VDLAMIGMLIGRDVDGILPRSETLQMTLINFFISTDFTKPGYVKQT